MGADNQGRMQDTLSAMVQDLKGRIDKYEFKCSRCHKLCPRITAEGYTKENAHPVKIGISDYEVCEECFQVIHNVMSSIKDPFYDGL